MYLASQRKEFILKTLAEHGAARTIALAKQMKVTDETVRNDLINLESPLRMLPGTSFRQTGNGTGTSSSPA